MGHFIMLPSVVHVETEARRRPKDASEIDTVQKGSIERRDDAKGSVDVQL